MRDTEQRPLATFEGQRVEDVVRRLHVVNRFNKLVGTDIALALEMERDFVFGKLSKDQAEACEALYDFIFHGVDFATPLEAECPRNHERQRTRETTMEKYFSYRTPSLDAKAYGRQRMCQAEQRWMAAATQVEKQTARRWVIAWAVIADVYPPSPQNRHTRNFPA